MGRGLLILVSGLVILVGILQKSIMERLQFFPERTTDYHQEMDAQNIANSLMEYGIRELDNNQNWQDGFSSNDFMGAKASLEVFTYDDYTNGNPDIPADHNIKNWDQYTLLLVSTATTSRTKAVTEVGITKDSFSKYTYFTDYEPSNIYFFDDDVLNGPVHTNGQLHIAGSPTFKGFVSSPNDWEGHPYYHNDPNFEGGSDFNSKTKEMPGPDKLSQLRNQGKSGGLSFDTEIRVEFKHQGTVEISEQKGSGGGAYWSTPTTYDLQSYNGVITSTKKVYAKGTLKGQVTLHSAEEVEIMGDLTYASDPQNNKNSTDMLGIVSEGDVTIDYEAHQDKGSKDLEIYASIMALDKSFEVEHYSYGSPRGTLKLYGGIQQQERGPVGTFGGGEVQSGFSKDYSYDNRLASSFPPFYPRESVYSQKYWREKPVQFL